MVHNPFRLKPKPLDKLVGQAMVPKARNPAKKWADLLALLSRNGVQKNTVVLEMTRVVCPSHVQHGRGHVLASQ